MSDKPTIEEIERSIDEDGISNFEILTDDEVVRRTTVEVIREMNEDEILLVTVSNGALSSESIDRIGEFIHACNDPSNKAKALIIEAEPLDDIRPEEPASINVTVVKRSDFAKGIAIEEGDRS